jgi:sRNA-binding carbon storage regulator CsrA
MSVVRHFDIKAGESLTVGDDVTITLLKKSGQLARLSVDKPENVRVEVKVIGSAKQASKGISTRNMLPA